MSRTSTKLWSGRWPQVRRSCSRSRISSGVTAPDGLSIRWDTYGPFPRASRRPRPKRGRNGGPKSSRADVAAIDRRCRPAKPEGPRRDRQHSHGRVPSLIPEKKRSFRLRFPEADIATWAARFGDDGNDDDILGNIRPVVLARGHLTRP